MDSPSSFTPGSQKDQGLMNTHLDAEPIGVIAKTTAHQWAD